MHPHRGPPNGERTIPVNNQTDQPDDLDLFHQYADGFTHGLLRVQDLIATMEDAYLKTTAAAAKLAQSLHDAALLVDDNHEKLSRIADNLNAEAERLGQPDRFTVPPIDSGATGVVDPWNLRLYNAARRSPQDAALVLAQAARARLTGQEG